MNTLDHLERQQDTPDFGFESFGMDKDFDINAAFQEALQDVVSDTELALEEKVRRMESIVTEGSSDAYREFIDFRQMAAQIEMFCSHDHDMNQSMQTSNTLSSFMDSHSADDGHNHSDDLRGKHNHNNDDDEYETDPKTGKKTKKKKRRGWLHLFYKA